jgi:hypothetical protein
MNPEHDLNTQHARQMLKDLKGKNNSEFTKVVHSAFLSGFRHICSLGSFIGA